VRARWMQELLEELGDDDAERLVLRLGVSDHGSAALAELLDNDDEAVAAFVAALRQQEEFPAGAAERWGPAVAEHRCTKIGSCLAAQARERPEDLDRLHALLRAASDGQRVFDAAERCVPTRKPSRLAHDENAAAAGRAFSAFQAMAATAEH
jgi:hypothetical protein